MVKINYADVHSPVFLNGKNLGQKLDPSKTKGLSLSYDLEEKRLWIEYNGVACFFGIEGAIHPTDPTEFGYKMQNQTVTPKKHDFKQPPMVAGAARTAQVETPMSRIQQPPTPTKHKQ